ncbi:MAG: T9SS type A sorting domain-containing protein [Candidatus Electryonea clarkiae]|nr:T9SS type A sorting domain-containing protein [Candidatus Electryonea clarkiae]MDP8287493.1 T9SS type A sorting domain-containing protein [Candidatus Electryonea clarkiae]
MSNDIEFNDNVYTVEAIDSVSIDNMEIDSYWWRVRAFDTFGLFTVSSEMRKISVTLSVEDESFTGIPTEYSISSIYPNPFNPELNIVIGLPEPSDLRIGLFNIVGREVAVISDNNHSPGYKRFVFDASELSSGIYFIHASVPRKMDEMRKVVLVK